MVMSSIELRTVNGDTIVLDLASSNPTVADAVVSLRTQHGYAPGVALMFAGRVLDNSRHLAEFPDGNVVIAGHTQSPRKAGGAPRTDSRRAYASGHTQQQQQPTRQQASPQQQAPSPQAGRRQAQPQKQASTTTAGAGVTSPQPAERGSTVMTLKLTIPAKNQQVEVQVADNATVEEVLYTAAAHGPELAKAKLVFQGKLLSEKPKEMIRNFGVHDGCTLHVALGPSAGGSASSSSGADSTTAVKLYEISQSFQELQAPAIAAGGVTKLESKERKMFYENSMKLLYRLDALEGLPAELKQQRKDLVKAIQKMQDEAQGSQQ